MSIANLISDVDAGRRPGLSRALCEYVRAHDLTAGGCSLHAASIMARHEVSGAAPHGTDIAALIAAYRALLARREREQRAAERRAAVELCERRLAAWDVLIERLSSARPGAVLRHRDGIVLTLADLHREREAAVSDLSWAERPSSP